MAPRIVESVVQKTALVPKPSAVERLPVALAEATAPAPRTFRPAWAERQGR